MLEPDLPDDLPTFVPPFFTAGFTEADFASVVGLLVVAGLLVGLLVAAGFVVAVCLLFSALVVACLPVDASRLAAVFVAALLLVVGLLVALGCDLAVVLLFAFLLLVLLFTSGFDVVLASVLVAAFLGCLVAVCLLVAVVLLLGVAALFVAVRLDVAVCRGVGFVVVVSAFLDGSSFFVVSGFFEVDCFGASVFVEVLRLLVFVHLEDLVSCLGVVEVVGLVVLTVLGCSAALGAAERVVVFGVAADFSSFFVAVVALLVRSLLMRAPVSVVVVLTLLACAAEVGVALRVLLPLLLWRLLLRELFE